MGAALSCLALPALGTIGSWALSCFSAAACSLACRSCNCNNSIATRVGYALIMLANSLLAWVLSSEWGSKQLEKITHGYLEMNCKDNDPSCYGAIGVQRVGFALALFHFILGALLIGVHDTRSKRAAIQNGWWGPKVIVWMALVVASFFIPTGFFKFYGNYVALIGAGIFILFGLILLVDFAHTWSESCMDKWELSDTNKWKFILVGSTMIMYLGAIVLTGVMYGYFASSGCGMNIFWITFNMLLAISVTVIGVLPAVQEANPRSGLAQSSMVVIYCSYLIMSAVANEPGDCNPLQKARGTRTTTVLLGAVFTFLAVAYSTSRAATQGGKASINQDNHGYTPIHSEASSSVPLVTNQPKGRSDALLAAVESGALPVSALDDEDDEDENEGEYDAKDDEKNGCQYNYTFFHVVFALATMYIAMLLTNWNNIETVPVGGDAPLIIIGQSWPAVWVKVVSSWICYGLYGFSLLAPVLLPDRFSDY